MVIKAETNFLCPRWRLSTTGVAETSSFKRRSNLELYNSYNLKKKNGETVLKFRKALV